MSTRLIEYKRNGETIIKIKLPDIERKSDGSLYRMTPKQLRMAKKLIWESCCNYDNGNCLALDNGEACVCPQSIGRTAFLMEKDPKYTDVIVHRWEAYTGQKAVLLNA